MKKTSKLKEAMIGIINIMVIFFTMISAFIPVYYLINGKNYLLGTIYFIILLYGMGLIGYMLYNGVWPDE